MTLIQRLSLLLLLCLMDESGFGQKNLVPNPSFEVISECPSTAGELPLAENWYIPTISTPDLYNECSTNAYYGIPPADSDSAQPRTGIGMARLGLWTTSGFREYVAIELSEELVSGQIYIFSMHLLLFNESVSKVGAIGALFTEDSMIDNSGEYGVQIITEAQINNPPSNIFGDSENWMHFIDTLIASGGESFLTIGNFVTDNQTVVDTQTYTWSAYFLDDVSLVEDTSYHVGFNTIYSAQELNLNLYPNPNTGTFTLDYGQLQRNATLRIRNTLSQILFERQVDKGSTSLTQHIKLNKGIYLLELDDDNKCQHQYMVVTD